VQSSMKQIRTPGPVRLGAAAALCLAAASPAAARPIATDSITPLPVSACDLSSCTPSDLGLGSLPANYFFGETAENVEIDTLGAFAKLYIYKDGIVSFGDPLPAGATLGDASTLGHAFAAPGFDSFAGHTIDVVVSLVPTFDPTIGPDGDYTGGLTGVSIYWEIDNATDHAHIFGVSLGPDPCDTGFNACFYYGSPEFSWWRDDATDAFLPDGALVGFPDAMHTVGVDLFMADDPNIQGNVSFSGGAVPEPSVWGLLILGFGAVGAVLRRRRSPTGALV
jgi:hypothetical protein